MGKIVTMGEMLMRLSTKNNEKFLQATDFHICYGGSESNVAISLANFGHESSYITRLPDSPIGQSAVATLRKYGVDTEYIAFGDGRLGIYFLEIGSSLRPSNVVYDRADSTMCNASVWILILIKFSVGQIGFISQGLHLPSVSRHRNLH